MSESKESVGHPVSDWRYDSCEEQWRASINLGDACHYVSVTMYAEPNTEFKPVPCKCCGTTRSQAVPDGMWRWGFYITMETKGDGQAYLDEVSGLVKDENTAKLAAERAALRSVQGFIDAFSTMEYQLKKESNDV